MIETVKGLIAAGAEEIVTCNSAPHPSNRIDLAWYFCDVWYDRAVFRFVTG